MAHTSKLKGKFKAAYLAGGRSDGTVH
jgi:hypothetical protein